MRVPSESDAKQAIRERVWSRLAQAQASTDPHGRIPDFESAAAAAGRLAELPAWQQARVLKANPDQPQLPVRVRALREDKLVYMAVPKLADPLPFFRLDPAELGDEAEPLAAHRVAAKRAPKTAVADMRPVDLIVCGTVAVNRHGVRIGKGAGYSDIEVGLLAEAGLIGPATIIVTTVHELQVIDEPLPQDEHDFTVDYIVTPEKIISCSPAYRPPGLVWPNLGQEQIAAIPVLAAMANKR
ncbi:MAG: 5-formyltetrahydrofolate cyclo-ligase [Pseudonocardiaceae bacterium]|nr:5-formyltetrahydrofolate cyclo-ligase [Pseudonocardiaceae bacterium]